MTTLLSHFYLKINGSDAPEDLMNDLGEIEVDISLHLPDMFKIQIRDPHLKWAESALLQPNQEVEILTSPTGEHATPQRLMIGEITSLEPDYPYNGVPLLFVRGYDRSFHLQHGKKSHTFVQMTDSDIVSSISRENGLTPEIDSTTEVYPHIYQQNQSDFEFIMERARRIGFTFLVNDRSLVFKKTTNLPVQEVELEYGIDLRRFLVRMSSISKYKEVIVNGWDDDNKREIIGHAGADEPGETGTWIVSRHPVHSQAEADALAKSILEELTGGYLQAEGVAVGNPKLKAGCKVNLKSLGSKFSGEYFLTRTRHFNDSEDGYLTEFSISGSSSNTIDDLLNGGAGSNPGLSGNGAPEGAVIGLVTNNQDPLGSGRVKIRFPWLDSDNESTWAPIVSPMAGNNRGLFILPEVGDEVLVIFEHGDMNHPFVLGGLWNGVDAPPISADQAVASSGSVKQRVWKTRTGHTITLDDSDDTPGISIVDQTGNNKIVIDSSQNRLSIEIDGDIEIKANQNVTVKSGANLSLQSDSNISIKASGTLDLESSATLTIKGSTVNIN
ncbi:MAG: VgrG-related protein [Anaerolineaceae bacterium]|nr:VgrG-related protein [Anaerolineaceae bacterium]